MLRTVKWYLNGTRIRTTCERYSLDTADISAGSLCLFDKYFLGVISPPSPCRALGSNQWINRAGLYRCQSCEPGLETPTPDRRFFAALRGSWRLETHAPYSVRNHGPTETEPHVYPHSSIACKRLVPFPSRTGLWLPHEPTMTHPLYKLRGRDHFG